MTTAAPTATAASAVGSTGPLQLHHPPGGGSGASSSSLLSSASASDGDDPASDAEAIELKALGCPARRGRAGGDGAESSGVEDGESVVAAGGSTTAAGFRLYTPDEERGVVGKFDRRLVGFVALLYMLGFLDRSNIGNARAAGMDRDLQTSPPRDDWYEWALSAFYLTYIAFEWLSLLWRVIPAHVFVSLIVSSWGLAASVQAVATSYPMLIVLRALLGVSEAGFTGIPLYLSFFFRREELAFRTAVFISAAPLATSFASTLAWLVLKLGEHGPITPWRLLFLLEGFPSILAAIAAWHIVPDSPQTASYLTRREKKVAGLRLNAAAPVRNLQQTPKTAVASRALGALVDPAALLTALIMFFTNMAYSSLPVFLPTMLEESMGHDGLRAQAFSAPPYLVSFVLVLAAARASDAMRSRSSLVITAALLSMAGYGVLALSERGLRLDPASPWRYLAVYPAASGFFVVVTLTLAWTINNQRTEGRQKVGFALVQVVGQCGPLIGARLYPRSQAPFYTAGMAACAAAMLVVAGLALVLRWLLARRNRALDAAASAAVGAGYPGAGEGDGLIADDGECVKLRSLSEGRGFRYML